MAQINLAQWVKSSPKQRYVLLKILGIDDVKRTSEDIRQRASRLNNKLDRASTKNVLNELYSRGLIYSELVPKIRRVYNGCKIYGKKLRRYYWLSERGKLVVSQLH